MIKAVAIFAVAFILALCACSRQKTLTRDKLNSELTSAKSLAAETEMFLDYVRQHRATKHYAEGHIEYLVQEVQHSSEELQKSSPPPGEQNALQNLKTQFDALNAELHTIRGRMDDQAALATAKEHIASICRPLMR